MPNRVTRMRFDEVSLVDVPANQHARVLITKAAGPQEDTVPDNDIEFETVDIGELEVGDVVLDENDQPIEVTQDLLDEINDLTPEDFVQEPEPVGKSYSEQVREALSKALGSAERDEVISKVAEQLEVLEKRAAQAEELAKREQDLRLEREYTERAAMYGLPVDPSVLGPVMKRAAELLPYEDCVVLNKTFEAAGELAQVGFEEIGKGSGSNADPFGIIGGLLGGEISKSDPTAVVKAFEENPELYDEWEREQRAARGF